MADTSYSDMKAVDNRGQAVSEVQLLADGSIRVHGMLPEGRELGYTLPEGVGGDEPPELVGWDVPALMPAVADVLGADALADLHED